MDTQVKGQKSPPASPASFLQHDTSVAVAGTVIYENNATGRHNLLSLPLEIRDMIYGYIFDPTGQYVQITPHKAETKHSFARHPRALMDSPDGFCTPNWGALPAGTSFHRTCRQVYEETLPLLYSRNIFVTEPTRPDDRVPPHDSTSQYWSLDLPQSAHFRFITRLELLSCVHKRVHEINIAQDLNNRFWPWALEQHTIACSLMPRLKTLRIILYYVEFHYMTVGHLRLGAKEYERVPQRVGSCLYSHLVSFVPDDDPSGYTHKVQHPAFDSFVHNAALLRTALFWDEQAHLIPQELYVGLLNQFTSIKRQFHLFTYNKFLDELKGKPIQTTDQLIANASSVFKNEPFKFAIPCIDLSVNPSSQSSCPYCSQVAWEQENLTVDPTSGIPIVTSTSNQSGS